MRFTIEQLTTFCVEACLEAGMTRAHSQITAEALVLTDSWGVHTHGTKNLRGYIRRIRAGGIRKEAQPLVAREGPAWALVDGDGAIGTVASHFAVNRAVQKAKASGIGFVGLKNSCHFGAAGVYACQAADQGLIGVAMSNDRPTVAVPGSRGSVLGSNPLAYAIPFQDHAHILLDIATSTVAGGKVFLAAARNEAIPEGWVIDENGKATTDPKLFPSHAALTPMAGHKGYGIAFLIETLSAIVTGASIGQHVVSWSFDDPSLPTNHGASFIAIDIGCLMEPDLFQARLRATAEEIRSAPRVPGVERIYLPGEKEWEHRQNVLQNGVDLPIESVISLQRLAEESKISLVSAD
jgi:ureidoglycolate dehydrogenase (NAD+)